MAFIPRRVAAFAALSAAVAAPLLMHGAPALAAPAAAPAAMSAAALPAGDWLAPTTAGPRGGGLEPYQLQWSRSAGQFPVVAGDGVAVTVTDRLQVRVSLADPARWDVMRRADRELTAPAVVRFSFADQRDHFTDPARPGVAVRQVEVALRADGTATVPALTAASRQGVLYASVNAEQAGGRDIGYHRGPHSAYTAIALKAAATTRTVPVPGLSQPSTGDHAAARAKAAQQAAERSAKQARKRAAEARRSAQKSAAQAREQAEDAKRAAQRAEESASRAQDRARQLTSDWRGAAEHVADQAAESADAQVGR
ncbi:hypothetical protein [Catellatospora vulcania]|uniref:hypothetical protein n=1 Tax=Catellatospora vulcania TaxID=1460450 RepID=UPI0012D3DC9C|nr:hypothetical protein [Catellatospora vulcania]